MLQPLILLSFALPLPAEQPAEALTLSVLYAGNEGTPYTASWQRMLESRVKSLRVMSLAKLEAKDLAGIDVLIIGGEVEEKDEKGQMRLKSEKHQLAFDALQGFPTVLMGGQGGFVSDEWKLKTSWRHG
jgi:hypothetical protein